MIEIEYNMEFSTAFFEVSGYQGEFDEDGVIEILAPCSCGCEALVCITADELQTLAEEAKKFRDRRVAYKAREEGA